MHCLTLYFLGAARPLYIEAGDFDHAAAQLFAAMRGIDPATRAKVETWAREIDAWRPGRHPDSRISCEHGALGLAYKFGRQDRAFARRMAAPPHPLPAFPGLDYSACVSNLVEEPR